TRAPPASSALARFRSVLAGTNRRFKQMFERVKHRPGGRRTGLVCELVEEGALLGGAGAAERRVALREAAEARDAVAVIDGVAEELLERRARHGRGLPHEAGARHRTGCGRRDRWP